MTGFAVDWLRLREPYDRAARAPELLAGLADWARGRTGLHVVDLGAGTGSARRALAGHLPADAVWTLVENDPALIAAGQAAFGDDARVGYRQADLDGDLDAIFAGQVDLVTASALIDLVSEPWLDRLVAHVLRRRCAVWIGLTYDGDLAFLPELPEDAEVAAAFDRDMTRDKGFGQALGPAAHDALASRLEGHGRLFTGSSPWRLGPQDRPIIDALIDGIGDAALASGSWRRQRHAVTTALRVGHRDLLFLP